MEGRTVHLDFETRSVAPFGKNAGKEGVSAYQYSIHPGTEVIYACYAFNDEPVKHWRAYRGDPFPDDLAQAVAAGWTIAAHNAGFEFLIWNNNLRPLFDLPELPIEQMDCTAARAAIMALPRDLDGVTKAMGMEHQKDDTGHKLMLKMSKPRRPRKNEDPEQIYWHESEADMERLGLYCERDVEAERGLDKVLKPMTKFQRAQWLRVHRANMRGVQVDIEFVRKARLVDEVVSDRYNSRLREITDGAVTSVTAMPAMKAWVQSQGIEVETLDKGGVIELLQEHQDKPHVCEVLRIRQTAGKSSVAKLDRFEVLTCEDTRRMLENFLFHAANTGRLGGRGAQLQNLPSRGGLPWYWAEECIRIILETDDPEWAATRIELIYGEIPTALSSCLRGIIQAPNGTKLFVADYSNIEGRVAAWLGDEKWKLEAFRAYDTLLWNLDGTPKLDEKGEQERAGPDLYKVTASQILGKQVEQVSKSERNVMGKVPELACLGPNTQVLTDRGYLRIVEVTTEHKLWDGKEWVSHAGLIHRGTKQVISLDGVQITKDHLVICGSSWKAAEKLASSESTLIRSLASGSENLPSLATRKSQEEVIEKPLCGVPAGLSPTVSTYPVSSKGAAHGATPVPRLKRPLIEKCTTVTQTRCRTTSTVGGYSTGYQLPSVDARTRRTLCGPPTGGAAYVSATSGERISVPSSATSKLAPAGTTPLLKWTEWTSTPDMNQEISGSLPRPKTRSISDESTSCKAASQTWSDVYDIANAGPRNRFTIRTGSGHLIVHNCGFGGGVGAFESMARIYHVDMALYWEGIRSSLDEQFVDKAYWAWGKFGEAQAASMGMTQEGWLASETVKNAWRDRHPGIVNSWAKCEELSIKALQNPGKWFPWANGKCAIGAQEIGGKMFLIYRLPSGRRLYRADASLKSVKKFGRQSQEIRFWGVDSVTRQWRRQSTYGGDTFQSFVQAIAFDIMDHGWANAEAAGFDVVLSVHDEVGAEGAEDRKLEEFEAAMNDIPDWAAGCPVSSAGYVSTRYRKDE